MAEAVNKHRRTAGHYVLLGGGVLVAAFLAFAAYIIIIMGPTMN